MATPSGSSQPAGSLGGGKGVSAAVSQVARAISALATLGVSAQIELVGPDSRVISVLAKLGPQLKSVRVSLRGTTPGKP